MPKPADAGDGSELFRDKLEFMGSRWANGVGSKHGPVFLAAGSKLLPAAKIFMANGNPCSCNGGDDGRCPEECALAR